MSDNTICVKDTPENGTPASEPNAQFGAILRKTYLLVRPYGRKRLGLVGFAMLVQAAFQVVGVASIFPFLSAATDPQHFRASGIGKGIISLLPTISDPKLITVTGLGAIALLFAGNAVALGAEWTRARFSQGYGHWLRMRLIESIAQRPYQYFLSQNTSILVKKITHDTEVFCSYVLFTSLDAIARGMTCLLLVATLLAVQPAVALFGGLALAGYYLAFYGLSGRLRTRISSGLKEAYRGLFLSVNQFLGGIKIVILRDCSSHFTEAFAVHSKTHARLSALSPILGNLPRYLIEPLLFGTVIAWMLFILSRQGQLSQIIPVVGILTMIGYRLLPNLQLLYSQCFQISTNQHSLDELLEEFTLLNPNAASKRPEEDHDGGPMEWNGGISLRKVCFSYPGNSRRALADINLQINRGDMVGFVGATGCGKSTLVDLIAGLLEPSSGSILLDGKILDASLRKHWMQKIGYVPQDIFLIDDTVTRNIAFGVADSAIDVEALRKSAERAQILGFIEHELDQGFDTVVGERGIRLSGGQRQRIGLARALYHNPDVLILDEATSALDSKTEGELMEAIDSLPKDLTILIIAHRLSTVRNCTMIHHLSQGGIERSGRFEDLARESESFRVLANVGNA